MKISYGITVHNEADELNRLLEILLTHIDNEDEIVICVDGDDKDVQLIIERQEHHKQIIAYKRKLEKDFAAHKNSVIENSTGDYIFHIDADEHPHETLLEQLKQIIEMNDNVDLIWIPRVNTIERYDTRTYSKVGLESYREWLGKLSRLSSKSIS